jgi:hypothetical protein
MFIVFIIVLAFIVIACIYVPIEVLMKDMSEKEKEEVWKNFYKNLEDNNFK